MTDRIDKLRRLWALTRPDKPLEDLSLYVQSTDCPAAMLDAKLSASALADPDPRDKHLLLGARGGGKSTELRRLAHLLERRGQFAVETVDLDATGVTASTVSASDVLYLCAVALLRRLPRPLAEKHFDTLKRAYAPRDADQLGDLGAALAGLRGFGVTTGAAVGAMVGQPAVGATIGGALVEAIGGGIRLFTRGRAPLSEASPEGRNLAGACASIVRSLREVDRRPPCVLFDGLEKMNGEANDRFRAVFVDTRLVVEAPWSMVVATPPSTLTVGEAVSHLGYQSMVVWGFPHQRELLVDLVDRRRKSGELPEAAIPREAIDAMVAMCGGLPRHLMVIFKEALWAAVSADAERVDVGVAEEGVVALGRDLAMGLDRTKKRILEEVHRTGDLPEQVEGAASLFGQGKILAEPPHPVAYRYRVHPILVKYVLDGGTRA